MWNQFAIHRHFYLHSSKAKDSGWHKYASTSWHGCAPTEVRCKQENRVQWQPEIFMKPTIFTVRSFCIILKGSKCWTLQDSSRTHDWLHLQPCRQQKSSFLITCLRPGFFRQHLQVQSSTLCSTSVWSLPRLFKERLWLLDLWKQLEEHPSFLAASLVIGRSSFVKNFTISPQLPSPQQNLEGSLIPSRMAAWANLSHKDKFFVLSHSYETCALCYTKSYVAAPWSQIKEKL